MEGTTKEQAAQGEGRGWLALACALACALSLGLAWPLPLQLGRAFAPNAFGVSHAWVVEHLRAALGEGAPLSPTFALGYPEERVGAFIGWVPLGLAALMPMGSLAAAQVVTLLSLPASAAGAWPLLRRLGASPPSAAAAALAYAVCPYMLGTVKVGEIPNLQAWTLPLVLWAALEGRHAVVALLAAATAFTSPYYGLMLPLLLLPFPRMWPALGAGLLPAFFYYGQGAERLQDSLFQPAVAATEHGAELAFPHPVASLEELFLPASPPLRRSAWEGVHLSYLGLPLVVGALVGRQRWPLLLALGGAVLALGPELVVNGHYTGVPAPAALLDLGHYPLGRGGMWYRLSLLAALGLCLSFSRLNPRWAWVFAVLQVGESLRAAGPWPMALEEVPEVSDLAGQDGAVLMLPLQDSTSQVAGQRGVLMAAIHGRPTTSLPRDLVGSEPQLASQRLGSWLRSPDPPAVLRDAGFRFVILDRGAKGASRYEWAEAALGPGERRGQLQIWDLGPTVLSSRGRPR